MNYKKYAQEHQKDMKYKIIEINDTYVTLQCKICSAIKRVQLKSLYRNDMQIHSQSCCKYFLDICREEIGEKEAKKFHDCYRRAHERCFNPHCKDFEKYKGKFHFADFTEYYHSCYDAYKEALENFPGQRLSIDRIQSARGYEPGNIRFVPMSINLQNKDCVRPVQMKNLKTGQLIVGISFGDLARKFKDVTFAASLHRACRRNGLYNGEWKIEYIEA